MHNKESELLNPGLELLAGFASYRDTGREVTRAYKGALCPLALHEHQYDRSAPRKWVEGREIA